MIALPMLKMLVGILDHHHGRVDHRADRDRDAPQGQYIGVEPLKPHHDEGDEDA